MTFKYVILTNLAWHISHLMVVDVRFDGLVRSYKLQFLKNTNVAINISTAV